MPAALDFSGVVDRRHHVLVSSTVDTRYDISFITLPCAQVEEVNRSMAAARISEPSPMPECSEPCPEPRVKFSEPLEEERRAPRVSLCGLLSSQRKFNCARKAAPVSEMPQRPRQQAKSRAAAATPAKPVAKEPAKPAPTPAKPVAKEPAKPAPTTAKPTSCCAPPRLGSAPPAGARPCLKRKACATRSASSSPPPPMELGASAWTPSSSSSSSRGFSLVKTTAAVPEAKRRRWTTVESVDVGSMLTKTVSDAVVSLASSGAGERCGRFRVKFEIAPESDALGEGSSSGLVFESVVTLQP